MKIVNDKEWEDLCDGCGKCCMHILEDEANGEFLRTSVACMYLDINTCRCTIYEDRFEKYPECSKITRENIKSLTWLPETCAYRLLSMNKELPEWHYLNSGSKETVHELRISVKNRAVSSENVHPDDLQNFIID